MSCMKCGKDTEDGQVFCAHCRETMENYPIKPDVHIQLPNRTVAPTPKRSSEKDWTRKKSQRTASLQRQVRWMWVVIIALLLALVVSLGADVVRPEKEETGKNYTHIDPTA